jgi:hypothetical protein
MKQRLVQIGIPVAGIWACAVLVPPMTAMPIILLVMSTLFRGGLKWHWGNLIIALVIALTVVEIFLAALLNNFTSDFSAFDPYTLKVLTFRGMSIVLPWLLGLGIGSLWLIRRRKQGK